MSRPPVDPSDAVWRATTHGKRAHATTGREPRIALCGTYCEDAEAPRDMPRCRACERRIASAERDRATEAT